MLDGAENTSESTQHVTVDQIVEERASRRELDAAPEPTVESAEEAAPVVEDTQDIQDDAPIVEEAGQEPEEVNLEGIEEGEDTEAVATPSIDAPQFWEAEEKVKFAALPKDVQEMLVAKDRMAQAAVTKATQRASEAERSVKERAAQLDQRIEGLSNFVSERDAQLKQYKDVNWANEYAQAGTDPQAIANVQQHKAYFDQLTEEKKQAESHIVQAEQHERQQSLETLDAELPKLDPSLSDPAKRIEVFQEVTRFAASEGIISQEDIPYLTAPQVLLARDAMLYRKAKKRAENPTTKPKPAAQPTVKPSTATGRTAPSSNRLRQLEAKGTLTDTEFVELRKLRRKAK